MERTWLETIQLLGLDLQVGVVLAALAVAGIVNLAKTLIHRLARLGGRKARLAPTSPIDAWPPQEWRHSH
jgi:hypothetical protein